MTPVMETLWAILHLALFIMSLSFAVRAAVELWRLSRIQKGLEQAGRCRYCLDVRSRDGDVEIFCGVKGQWKSLKKGCCKKHCDAEEVLH